MVRVVDVDGFPYIINIEYIMCVQPATDFCEYRIMLPGFTIIISEEEYEEKLRRTLGV